jgi:YD repeat-containing protein
MVFAAGVGPGSGVTDPLGRQWAYGYNTASDLTSATDPMGH